MGNLIYPANLPGLTWNSTRGVAFNTGVQPALSAKESRIAYQLYPVFTFELAYELLRDYVVPSDAKALFGLFMACNGKWDTFLYNDPVFNTVSGMQFATGTGVLATSVFQLSATYQNSGGPGGAEIIQNLNGVPLIYSAGTLVSASNYSISGTGLVTFTGYTPASGAAITWSGSFYYRCRFDDDALTLTQFMSNFWEAKKISLRQVKL
jgi:uncharacterized protein (TIGR02217 family)